MTERELILYAWPTGPLADSIDHFVERATADLGPTAAQSYPVHCTLTGFFRRARTRADETLSALGAVVAECGDPEPVVVERLGIHESWVGLELTSPGLLELIDAVVEADQILPGEDALRPKDWLHVSLAYGVASIDAYAALARETIDPSLDAAWRVGFWERQPDGTWHRP